MTGIASTEPNESSEPAETFAAVDLGSNSFHLVVARREHGELRFIDRIKEMVRLAGGLDRGGYLDLETQERALDCLARFGQRLRGIPDANIRAVGTQSLRRMRNANAFLMIAETALGCPVDIIGGREEARLVYLGVSQGVAGVDERRLVIDIGGGSTELVIGEGLQPLEMESLQFGCVSTTQWYFGNGKISRRKFAKAQRAVMAELQELQVRYRQRGWASAIGSSGTIRAAAAICANKGYSEERITAEALARLKEDVLAFPHTGDVNLPGLSQRRQAVFVGGLVLLSACFEVLGIEVMKISPYALREGVLHDMLGRLEHQDPRDKTVQAFRARYGVNEEQAERVKRVSLAAFDAIAGDDLRRDVHGDFLAWAADLHEVGLSVSHSHYQRHSGYLVRESDMAGFTQQEQAFLATLILFHRRDIPRKYAGTLPPRLHEPLRLLLFCLRLACVFCRTRDDTAIPDFALERDGHDLSLRVDAAWAMAHPLTLADLEHERGKLRIMGLQLDLSLGLDEA